MWEVNAYKLRTCFVVSQKQSGFESIVDYEAALHEMIGVFNGLRVFLTMCISSIVWHTEFLEYNLIIIW